MTPEELVAALKNDPALIDDLTQLIESRQTNGSSDQRSGGVADTEPPRPLKGTVAFGSLPADTLPTTDPSDRASDVAPCQAIRKKDGKPCPWPASKSGKYGGKYCRLHATEAGKREKHNAPEAPNERTEVAQPASSSTHLALVVCWYCGQAAGKTPLIHEDGRICHGTAQSCLLADDCPWRDQLAGEPCEDDNHRDGCLPLPPGWRRCIGCSRARPQEELEEAWAVDYSTDHWHIQRLSELGEGTEVDTQVDEDGEAHTFWMCLTRCDR